MAFRVGQKVVCVDDNVVGKWHMTPSPVSGHIYTVRWVGERPTDGGPVLLLDEIRGERHRSGVEYAPLAVRFRPVDERKTDISIFTAMLNPSKEHVRS